MGLVAKAGGDKEFQIVPAGPHLGRCYMVVDLGTQETTYKGQTKRSHKVLIGWELLNEKMADGRPFVISSRYTLSLFDQAILRQHLESWRGRGFTEEELAGFNIGTVAGAYCFLSVVHNKQGDKTYANVAGIMPVPKGMDKPPAVNPNVVFDMDDGDITSLPEWIQNIVKKSVEWQQRGEIKDMPDDLPWEDEPNSVPF